MQNMQNLFFFSYVKRKYENMLNMPNNMYKICNEYANKYAEYVKQYVKKYVEYAEYAKSFSDVQNM